MAWNNISKTTLNNVRVPSVGQFYMIEELKNGMWIPRHQMRNLKLHLLTYGTLTAAKDAFPLTAYRRIVHVNKGQRRIAAGPGSN